MVQLSGRGASVWFMTVRKSHREISRRPDSAYRGSRPPGRGHPTLGASRPRCRRAETGLGWAGMSWVRMGWAGLGWARGGSGSRRAARIEQQPPARGRQCPCMPKAARGTEAIRPRGAGGSGRGQGQAAGIPGCSASCRSRPPPGAAGPARLAAEPPASLMRFPGPKAGQEEATEIKQGGVPALSFPEHCGERETGMRGGGAKAQARERLRRG